MAEHAKLSASSAKKWLNCAGSIALEKRIPKEESTFAQEGTTAHKLAEIKIKKALSQITQRDYANMIKTLKIDDDMNRHTDDYKDFVLTQYRKGLIHKNDVLIELEKRVDYSNYAPEGFGTSDVVIVTDRHIEIIDFKYGKGVKVDATNNYQLMLYALGALNAYDWLYDITNVTMTIFQPRLDNISSYEMSASELYEWGKSIKEKAQKAYTETGECVVGTHCTEGFCRAIPICRAFAEYIQTVNNSTGKKPRELTHDELIDAIEKADNLAKWAKGIKEYVLQQMLQGVEFEGYKLVEGRKSRVFSIDDDEVAKILLEKGYTEDIVYKKEVRTVADMQKQLKVDFDSVLGQFVLVKRGSPTIAPIDDSRPTYSSAESDFKEIKS